MLACEGQDSVAECLVTVILECSLVRQLVLVYCGHLGLCLAASVVLTTAGLESRVLLGSIIACTKTVIDCIQNVASNTVR